MQQIIGQEPVEYDDEITDDQLERQVRADLGAGRIDSRSSGWVCETPPDGTIACGPRNPRDPKDLTDDDVMLIRQEDAGEEDQSVPGWDHGA